MAAEAGGCPEPDSAAISSLPGYPPGSGSCGCSPAEGPFSSVGAPATALGEGDCCYIIYSIGCDGRPLRQDDTAIVAGVLVRADWGRSVVAPVDAHV